MRQHSRNVVYLLLCLLRQRIASWSEKEWSHAPALPRPQMLGANLQTLKIKEVLQVLYLTEPIDEPALNNISEFKDFKFVDVTREDLDLGDVAEDEKKKVRNHHVDVAELLSLLLHCHTPLLYHGTVLLPAP